MFDLGIAELPQVISLVVNVRIEQLACLTSKRSRLTPWVAVKSSTLEAPRWCVFSERSGATLPRGGSLAMHPASSLVHAQLPPYISMDLSI